MSWEKVILKKDNINQIERIEGSIEYAIRTVEDFLIEDDTTTTEGKEKTMVIQALEKALEIITEIKGDELNDK